MSRTPTERQRRNRRWLSSHRVLVSTISAAVFGAIGLAYGLWADASWLNPVTGLLIGAVFGAGIGWGFSVDSSDTRLRGARKVVYVAVLVFAGIVLIGMRYIRSTT